jgi:hypothetical protein
MGIDNHAYRPCGPLKCRQLELAIYASKSSYGYEEPVFTKSRYSGTFEALHKLKRLRRGQDPEHTRGFIPQNPREPLLDCSDMITRRSPPRSSATSKLVLNLDLLSRRQDHEHKRGCIPRRQQLKLDKGAGVRFIQHTSPRTPATTSWNPEQTLLHFLRILPFTPCNPEQDQLSFEHEFNDRLEQDADSTIDSFFASNGSGGQVKESDALEGLFEKYRGKIQQ